MDFLSKNECVCEICKKSFFAIHPSRRFCSIKCRNKNNGLTAHINRYVHADVTINCETCQSSFVVKWAKRSRRFCNKRCKNNFPSCKVLFTERVINGDISVSSEARKRAGLKISGDNNPSKRPEVRARISASVKIQSDPKKISKQMRLAYAQGKISMDRGVGGYCKWYDHTKPDGTIVKLQGTWEVAFARWLDSNKIEFLAHHGRIPYIGKGDVERSYYPDFYIPQSDMYVDVKGGAFLDSEQEKINYIRKSNPELNLLIANKDILNSFKIDYISAQKELL